MSKTETAKGILRTFWVMTTDEFNEMDHKLVRIISGAIGFAIAAAAWFFFFRHMLPFG